MMISEVSKKYTISQDTLRYYEKIGLIPNVQRNKGGFREYSEHDCLWIQVIKWMRTAGMPIVFLIEYVNLVHKGDETKDARITLLAEQRKKLVDQIKTLQSIVKLLDEKIESYDEYCVPTERNMTTPQYNGHIQQKQFS